MKVVPSGTSLLRRSDDSHASASSRCAGRPASSMSVIIRAASPGSHNQVLERLIGRTRPLGHSVASSIAAAITAFNKSAIKPGRVSTSMNSSGSSRPRLEVLPPGQGFEPPDPEMCQVKQRLKVGDKLTAVHSTANFAF